MRKKIISDAVKEEIEERVSAFNEKKLSREIIKFYPKIQGQYIYLMYLDPDGSLEPVCRLTYAGDLDDMKFALYKYSMEKYDSADNIFDGSEFLDGTLEGAMKAGLTAYPP